ncbi:hypothetical protein H072_10850 [Dactylellina haptotyla CBS 200.50]|uniref:diphosphoinositol-polyphosphate diphosphatase n=1 Tax=Dactylellina haptotyla (strain CBS 200.50) TaxID=1284197 RepID=S7ZY46_DACHA|nr:hypothetical protein H072_10850 [Dactylellina haptotyla CBS 200.50]
MIAISTPRREDAFPSSLASLPGPDVNFQDLNSPIPLSAFSAPSVFVPRSITRGRSSSKRPKLSRSMSSEEETAYSFYTMKFLGGGEELEELNLPDDSEDDASGASLLTRTNTTSTGSLCFQIPEESGLNSPQATSPTILPAYTLSTKSMLEEYDVPRNFSMVWPGVYRSSFPAKANFPYLKMLKLKTILTLIPEKYPQSNVEFMQSNGIQHIQIGIAANKEPFVEVPLDKITQAVSIILDKRNHPILIHCNKGKHRTGCIVGCLRKIQKWTLCNVFDEYRRFSYPKERVLDEQVIELWEETQLLDMAKENGWVR